MQIITMHDYIWLPLLQEDCILLQPVYANLFGVSGDSLAQKTGIWHPVVVWRDDRFLFRQRLPRPSRIFKDKKWLLRF